MMSIMTEIRLLIVLTGLLTLPGWAALALSGLWRRWDGLQRWIRRGVIPGVFALVTGGLDWV